MPVLTWELWLARQVVVEKPLPWQKKQTLLTPRRVRQSFGSIIAQIGTPIRVPKPCGKSLGWPQGKMRRRAERHPIIKKFKLFRRAINPICLRFAVLERSSP